MEFESIVHFKYKKPTITTKSVLSFFLKKILHAIIFVTIFILAGVFYILLALGVMELIIWIAK